MMRFATARLHLIGAAAVLASVLSWGIGAARTWHVPGDTPTIQAGIDAATAGDDVLVAPGEYHEHDIVMKGGVWLHSEAGPTGTILDASGMGRVLECVELTERATIEGFSIQNGQAPQGDEEVSSSGGGIHCVRSALRIRDCHILACEARRGTGGGVYGIDSDIEILTCQVASCYAEGTGGICLRGYSSRVTLRDCVATGNNGGGTAGGMWVEGFGPEITNCVFNGNSSGQGIGGMCCSGNGFSIASCVFRGNTGGIYAWGSALEANGGPGLVTGCTAIENVGPGAALGIRGGVGVHVERSILAFNVGRAMMCDPAAVDVRCCDFFGNSLGNELCGGDLGGNFSSDPHFCNRTECTLSADSPCLPGQHPDGVDCGLVGARGEGCEVPPTGACCFHGLCFVLEEQQCEDRNGDFHGDGTTCDPNPCEPTPIQPTTWGRIKASYR
jgi:hypothetical protein